MHHHQLPQTGSPEHLQWQQQTPLQPGPGQVLLRNKALAVNYLDLLLCQGALPEGMLPALPLTPGVESVGQIEALGPEVRGWQVGQAVGHLSNLGVGTYGEHCLVPAENLVALPEGLDWAEAATIPVNYTTALHLISQYPRLETGDSVLVHAAAGGVGSALVDLLSRQGMKVYATVSSEAKAHLALDLGAELSIFYREENVPERILHLTEGAGVEASFNPVAGTTLLDDLQCLAPLGTLVVYGFLQGLPEKPLQESLMAHYGKSPTVAFSDLYTLFFHRHAQLKAYQSELFRMLERRAISPAIYRRLPLEKAAEALKLLEEGRVLGKAVLEAGP